MCYLVALVPISDLTDVKECNKRRTNEAEYLAGYSKCLREISAFLEQTRTSESSLKKDIVNHVTGKIKKRLTMTETVTEKDNNTEEQSVKTDDQKHVAILPAVQSQVTTNDTPIDLSSKVICSTGFVANTTNSESAKTSSASSHGEQTFQPHNVYHQPPVGLLCGGQVMLLVQLPQSVLSQSTPAIAHQHPTTHTALNHTQQISDIRFPNLNSSFPFQPMPLINTSSVASFPQTSIPTAHAQTECETPAGQVHLINFMLPPNNDEDNNNNLKRDHWRPW